MADTKKNFGAAIGGYMQQRPVSPVDRIVTGQPTAKPGVAEELAETAEELETSRLNLRVKPEIRRELEAAAAEKGVKLSALVKMILFDYVKERKAQRGE